jgi:ABC-type branched-subunit amino acid transport system permease subunit
MTANVGGIDRILRIVAGLALLSLVFVGPQTLWGLVGLVPLGTALIGYCPAYTILGLNTCPAKPAAR